MPNSTTSSPAPTSAENGYQHSWHLLRPTGPTIRPAWDDHFLNVARAVSARGDCIRSQVGAVVVDPGHRIVAADSNRPPYDQPNSPSCLAGDCQRCLTAVPRGHAYEGCIEIHAERNAIAIAGPACKDATLYITHTPCPECLTLVEQSGLAAAIWPGGSWHDNHLA